jgi:hypothetical protein
MVVLPQGKDRMKPRHEVTARPRRLTGLRRLLLTFCAVTALTVTCFGCGDASGKPGEKAAAKVDLPEISAFLTKPSDRFLVDIEDISRGHPLLGVSSPHPHGGGHVHFDNSKKRWPKGKDEPANYPAIYAVADGIVGRIDTRFGLPGGNDRYGVDLVFAMDKAGAACRFCYSIEPMCPEPTEGLYQKFLLVKEGQKVRKGDVIAYLCTPPSSGDGCHIHFHLTIDGKKGFLAPAIFTPEVVKAFHQQCQGFQGSNDGTPIPPCMGYRIGADENRGRCRSTRSSRSTWQMAIRCASWMRARANRR